MHLFNRIVKLYSDLRGEKVWLTAVLSLCHSQLIDLWENSCYFSRFAA